MEEEKLTEVKMLGVIAKWLNYGRLKSGVDLQSL